MKFKLQEFINNTTLKKVAFCYFFYTFNLYKNKDDYVIISKGE